MTDLITAMAIASLSVVLFFIAVSIAYIIKTVNYVHDMVRTNTTILNRTYYEEIRNLHRRVFELELICAQEEVDDD